VVETNTFTFTSVHAINAWLQKLRSGLKENGQNTG